MTQDAGLHEPSTEAPKTNPISFRDEALSAWLETMKGLHFEASTGLQARTELSMWKDALAWALRRQLLPLEWATAIAEVVAGPLVSLGLGALVYVECRDAFEPDAQGRSGQYADQYGVDEEALLQWASLLDPVTDLALRRAFAMWWSQPDRTASVVGFAAVGIRCTTNK